MLERTPSSTLFPYTTLFRSQPNHHGEERAHAHPVPFGAAAASAISVQDRKHKEHEEREERPPHQDRKSTRLNSSHMSISYAVFCLNKKTQPWKSTVAKHKAL